MFQSNGVLVKSMTTIWEGTPAEWPATLQLGNLWSSYSELYRRQLWVNVVIDKRAKALARLPYKVYERADGGRKSGADSPYGRLMAQPCKTIDTFLLWLWTASTKDIHGEAFWLKVRDRGGRPVECLPIHPTKVIEETDDDGKTVWKIRLRHGEVIVERRDLIPFREFNPDTLLRGMSKLEPLRSTLENEDGARRANSALWRNGGRPSVYLQHPKVFANDAVARRLSTQWNDIHSGVDNWAKAAILEEGMTANAMPLNVEELQYIEARKLNREEVCAAFDMAPPVVHILDRATFSNITEQHRSMYRDTMGTVLGSFESTLEYELRDGRHGKDVAPDFGDVFYGEFLLDEVLRGDFEARQDALQKADHLTLAEKREIENKPFIEGTQYIFLNSATLPLGEDGLLKQPTSADTSGQATPTELALLLQKLYLAVGVVITPEEARDIVNRAGGGLTGPGPTVAPKSHIIDVDSVELDVKSVRSVMGRLGRAKSLSDIDPEQLVTGIDADAVAVLKQLLAAQIAYDDVDGLKSRLRALTTGRDQ